MTLRQFEVFLAVARAQSFRRAAETLHLSQPALSQHVRELEGALGARLFDRLGRAVHLTEAGRILEDHATRLFATLTDAQHAIADLLVIHRAGAIEAGEPIVLVAAASAHRAAAFAATEELMDFLKTDAPFWKREVGADGERWVEPSAEDYARRGKHGT